MSDTHSRCCWTWRMGLVIAAASLLTAMIAACGAPPTPASGSPPSLPELVSPVIPTSSPMVAISTVLWSADHETGDLSQWYRRWGGGVYNSNSGAVTITEDTAHSGRYALKLTISAGSDNKNQAARIFRWGENPVASYYSAWLLFPKRYTPKLFWNVFQFKSKSNEGVSTAMWVLNVGTTLQGDMMFYLWDAIHQQPYDRPIAAPPPTIPVGRWIHVEAFYRRATDGGGRIAIWQDGVLLYDIDQVQTAIANNIQWSLDNYTDGIDPPDATIFADDAFISTVRIGP